MLNNSIKFLNFIRKQDSMIVVNAPLLIACLPLFLALLIPPNIINPDILIGWMAFWGAMGGLAIIIKNEIPRPGYQSIKGLPAKIVGLIWLIFGAIWFIATLYKL